MFSQDDESTGVVMGVVFGVIALVISLIIGLTIYQKNKTAKAANVATAVVLAGGAGAAAAGLTAGASAMADAKSDAAMTAAAQAAADAASVMVEGGVVKFFFASGKAELAKDGVAALKDVVAGVKAGKKAVISGYVDNTGDPEKNKQVAKERAFAVRDLLKIAGVSEESVVLQKPEDIKAGVGAAARRVEVTLQ
jgi:outer membrane protein OmpA-like peptidoglycan-associated protein